MNVEFEFLSEEPLENVVTCMNYRMDKAVFFGFHDIVERRKASTEAFLKNYCGVQRVVFHTLSRGKLDSTLDMMRKAIELELGQKNNLFFDITGGQSMILVAFGMLAREFHLPVHFYDIETNKLTELETGAGKRMSEMAPESSFRLDLDKYIRLQGGVINYTLQKDLKGQAAEENAEDLGKLWEIAERHHTHWNAFSEFLRNNMVPDDNLLVHKRAVGVLEALYASTSGVNSLHRLQVILEDLADAGIITGLQYDDDIYEFSFKNEILKDCIWDSGSILELHIYELEKKNSDDCRVGVHLDWDGVIQGPVGIDVQNEIDVLKLEGNIPTFISCKSGNLNATQTLRALYELQTIADRFGGKYAKKVLVVQQDIGKAYMFRSKEMEIEVIRI